MLSLKRLAVGVILCVAESTCACTFLPYCTHRGNVNKKIMRFLKNNNSSSSMSSSSLFTTTTALLLTVLLAVLPATTVAQSSASEKDPNSYPWGDNPNNGYKMYWKDSPNILNSLLEFESLYIKVHGCVWSEYGLGVTYDDDGENHDGDEQWYLTRIQPFRANAAFSLYGVLRSDGSNFMGRNCRKGTYINTFFTYEGADTVLQAFQSSVQTAFPDGYYGSAYCYDYERPSYDDDDGSGSSDSGDSGDRFRKLDSGSGDGDGGDSMTMGCSADSKFVVATFEGSACDGMYFMNSTDDLSDYNSAMDHLSCAQVWNYRKAKKNGYGDTGNANEGRQLEDYYGGDDGGNNDDASSSSTYGSIAETLLASSFACDITLYPDGLCPDPYGLKAKYAANLNASARKGKSVRLTNWQLPLQVVSWFFLVGGAGLSLFAYFLLRRQNANHKGGGIVGWAKQIWADIYKLLFRKSKKEKSVSSSKLKKSRSSKRSSSRSRKDGIIVPPGLEKQVVVDEEGGADDDDGPDEKETISPTGSSSRKRRKSKTKKDKYVTEEAEVV